MKKFLILNFLFLFPCFLESSFKQGKSAQVWKQELYKIPRQNLENLNLADKTNKNVVNLWKDEVAIRHQAASLVKEILEQTHPVLSAMKIEPLLRENRDLKERLKASKENLL